MFSSMAYSGLLRLVVLGLYSLLLLCLAQTVVVLYLYATRHVDTTIVASLMLSFVGVSRATHRSHWSRTDVLLGKSQLSIIFILIHSLLARCHRLDIMYNCPRTNLSTLCRFLPRILIILWMIAAAVGMIVAARQPKCMPGIVLQDSWQFGLSCQLHRATVGMSAAAL
jgi:hypothetical protein